MDRDLVEMKRAQPVPPTTYLNKAKNSTSTGDLTLGTDAGAHMQPLLRTLSVKEGVLSSLTYNNTLYNSNICHDEDNIIVDRKSFHQYPASTSGRGQNYDPNPIYLINNYNDDEDNNNNDNMYDETKSVCDSDEDKSDTALLHTSIKAYIPRTDTNPSEYSLSLPIADLSPKNIRVSSMPDPDSLASPVSTPLVPASTPDVRRLKLLVVDDSTMNRKMLCRLLTSQGYDYDGAGKI